MKINFDETGLSLEAESAIERFALNQWTDLMKKNSDDSLINFQIVNDFGSFGVELRVQDTTTKPKVLDKS